MPVIKSLVIAGLTALLMAPALLAAVLVADPSPARAACGNLPSSLGSVTMTINVPSAGPYRIWVRELAPTAGASGFYLQLADAGLCQVTMGNGSITAKSWTWVDYQNGNPSSVVSATITAGNHTVKLAGLSSGTEVDKVELLSDTGCTPTGDGTNCTNSAVTATASPAPSGQSSSPAGPTAGSGGTPSSGTTSNSGNQLKTAASRYFWPLAGLAVVAVVAIGWLIAHQAALRAANNPVTPETPEQSEPAKDA